MPRILYHAAAAAFCLSAAMDGAVSQPNVPRDYERREDEIYGALIRHLAASDTLLTAHGAAGTRFCVGATALAPPPRYHAELLTGIGGRTSNPRTARYNQLARASLNSRGRFPAAARALDRISAGTTIRVERVALAACDQLIYLVLTRPTLDGSSRAFLYARLDDTCSSSHRKFAIIRRGSEWRVEGDRNDSFVAGAVCDHRPRSGSAQPDAQALLVHARD